MVLLLLLAHLRTGVFAALIDVAATARDAGADRAWLFPLRTVWPRALVQEGGSALQIELANMQGGG